MNWHKLYVPLVILTVALAVFMGLSWLRTHDALLLANAQEAILKHENADLQKQIDAAGKAEKAANDALDKEKHKPATVQTVNHFIPLPGPIQVVTEPGKPAEVVISGDPQKNLDALQDFAIECQKCNNSLAARNTQLADVQQQLALSEKNAANWKRAAKGHTGFWANVREYGIRAGFAAGGFAAGRLVK